MKRIIVVTAIICFAKIGMCQHATSNIIKNAVKDYDGNTYDAVKIGDQVWTKTNMRCTHYADGTEITKAYQLKSGAYIVSNEEPFYYLCPKKDPRYGLYYNWLATTRGKSSNTNPSGVQGICPNGWHIPSVDEWLQLFKYVGSIKEYRCFDNPLYIAKSLCSNEGWAEVEYVGRSYDKARIGYKQDELNNATNFSALPAGEHTISHGYYNSSSNVGDEAMFWTTNMIQWNRTYHVSFIPELPMPNYLNTGDEWFPKFELHTESQTVIQRAFSVRCVRDIDTLSLKLESSLREAIRQYEQLFNIYPSVYQQYKTVYTVPVDVWGKHDSLQNMIRDINNKKLELEVLYETDSIVFAKSVDTLQNKVRFYNNFIGSYPKVYSNYKISYAIPNALWGKTSSIHDTLTSMLKEIDRKQNLLINQYYKDSIDYESANDTLQRAILELNKKLLQYPYNLSNKTLSDNLSLDNFGNKEMLHDELSQKLDSLPIRCQIFETEIYNDLKSSKPSQFVDVYFNQHQEKKKLADSLYVECRCEYRSILDFRLDFIDQKIAQCSCRIQRYNEDGSLFKDKTEFDSYYNLSETKFEQEITNRKQLRADLQKFESELSTLKSVSLKKAIHSDKPDVKVIVERMAYHQQHCYYEEALAILFNNNEGLSKEWGKNGLLFKDRAEMYEAYISEDYAKVLKSKKKDS